MNELEWSPHFSYYNLMGAICYLILISQLDSEIFMFESVDAQTEARTDASLSPNINSAGAFGSGELKRRGFSSLILILITISVQNSISDYVDILHQTNLMIAISLIY